MIIDGRAIAKDILASTKVEASRLATAPSFLALAVQPSFATRSYLAMKQRQASQVGIRMEVMTYEEATTAQLIEVIQAAIEDAVIVQLPLPDSINTRAVLDAIPVAKDADALSSETRVIHPERHPVASAIREVLTRNGIDPQGQQATVVGNGWLVGSPAAAWLASVGAAVTTVTREQGDLHAALMDADIVVSGAGSPGLIGKQDVKPGAVVIDIGTSELGGTLTGDVQPEVAEVASVFTPVPGGVGPITVAFLLKNVVALAADRIELQD
jgi:methylenetetrahydrofolate dehydrogenase (NADP+) / methenyltetrahydrofolate cyclohydrolase